MLNPLSRIVAPSVPVASVRLEIQPSGAAMAAVPGAKADQTLPATKLERLLDQAARDRFPGREVAVESFYDKDSGRYVHRIADSESGELLLQTPPDELLRFFASGREPYGQPLLDIDA